MSYPKLNRPYVQCTYKVVLTVPPNFENQNEKTSCSQQELCFQEIVNVRKLLHGCASFFLQFGTENQKEQLKKHPVRIQNL